jgi:hypothetical protein
MTEGPIWESYFRLDSNEFSSSYSNTICANGILFILVMKNDFLFVHKKQKLFIGRTLGLDFLNNRQNVVDDVHCCSNLWPKHFHR